MKRVKTLLVFCLCLGWGVNSQAQYIGLPEYIAIDKPDKKVKDPNYKYNGIFLVGNLERSSYNTNGLTMGLEYNTAFKRNLLFGLEATYTNFDKRRKSYPDYDADPLGPDPYINTVYHKSYGLAAKVLFDFPVYSDWLFFRLGVGIGAGYYELDRMEHHSVIPDDTFRPMVLAEANWIVRLWNGRVDLKFSPLVWGPSHLKLGFVGIGRPTTNPLYHYDMGHFAVGVKF